MIRDFSNHSWVEGACVVALGLLCTSGCARANIQETADAVADAVTELRDDVERQQLIRTELSRSAAERIAEAETETATRAASRDAELTRLPKSVRPLLEHSAEATEASDPRYTATLADEAGRRETVVGYVRHVDQLETLHRLLELLSEGSTKADVMLYLRVGAEAAGAAGKAWGEGTAPAKTPAKAPAKAE